MPEPIDRRRFISAATALAMLGGAGITIACGDSSPGAGPTPPPPPTTTSKTGLVLNNHGHSAVIQAAALDAGGGLTLDIRGNAQHPHTVTLTAAQVVSIRGGNRVEVQSSTDDPGLGAEFIHSHMVTFN